VSGVERTIPDDESASPRAVRYRRAMRILGILLVTTSVASAAPVVVPVTSTQLRHSAEPAIAHGGGNFAVVWEEMEPNGKERHIAAAIVSEAGKLTAPAKRIFLGGALPNEISLKWNGTSFTVAVCNASWAEKKQVVWGTLGAGGAFTKSGEYVFPEDVVSNPNFSCALAAATADGGELVVGSKNERSDDPDDYDCSSWRISLAKGKPTLGKDGKVCEVWAADATWYVGAGAKDKATFVDKAGKATAKPKLTRPSAVLVRGTSFGWLGYAKKTGMQIEWGEPPYKKAPAATALEKGPLGLAQINHAAVLDDGTLLLAASTPTGFEAVQYKPDGKVGWSGTVAKRVQYFRCAASKLAACVFTDDDKTYKGEVRVVVFAP
jgi:hypothetical protein